MEALTDGGGRRIEDLAGKGTGVFALADGDRWRPSERRRMPSHTNIYIYILMHPYTILHNLKHTRALSHN